MPVTICRHIKTNGKRCQSPSLGLSAFCYFHSRLHRRHRNLVENTSALADRSPNPATSAPGTPQYLPDHATQIQSSSTSRPSKTPNPSRSPSPCSSPPSRNRIDPKRAAVLLYGLQLASTNAKSITIEPYASSITRAITRTKSGLDLAVRDTA